MYISVQTCYIDQLTQHSFVVIFSKNNNTRDWNFYRANSHDLAVLNDTRTLKDCSSTNQIGPCWDCAMMKIKNHKRSCYLYCYLLIASTIISISALVAVQKFDTEAAAQIESNSSFTTCINGKCVTTTTTCVVNQPCHTVRSNVTNTNDNNSTNDNNNNGNNIVPEPFDQGTI
jgi:hypothetical protein